jgi:Zn-dependent protease
MNFCLGFPLLFVPHIGTQLALCNVMLCIVNLIPLPSSDGLRIWRNLWNTSAPGSMVPAPTLPESV